MKTPSHRFSTGAPDVFPWRAATTGYWQIPASRENHRRNAVERLHTWSYTVVVSPLSVLPIAKCSALPATLRSHCEIRHAASFNQFATCCFRTYISVFEQPPSTCVEGAPHNHRSGADGHCERLTGNSVFCTGLSLRTGTLATGFVRRFRLS